MATMLGIFTAFFFFSMSGAFSPGPLTTMAIVEGSRRGKWSGTWLSLGHGLVEAPYMAVLALILWWGRETILEDPLIAGSIAFIGGGFLVWMGWSLARDAWRRVLSLTGGAAKTIRFGLIPTGLIVTVSNPYWWLWWALLTPFYIQESFAWGVLGVILLFVVHWLTDLIWLTGLAWLTGSGRSLISERIYRRIMIGCGGVILFFGVVFIWAGFRFIITGEVSLG